ncbi:hypothetical protein Tcan_10826 [Toxocara canis]|uniref:Uncharacterized protein n=1 Tax=Toxocara canis TaxID=6265 RepID=A0A0B2USG5_TOXCA|nr:hypothetical protein Tcan_10826 [Toxocara canis]
MGSIVPEHFVSCMRGMLSAKSAVVPGTAQVSAGTTRACLFTVRYNGGKYQSGASNIQKKRLIALLAFSAPTHLTNVPDTVSNNNICCVHNTRIATVQKGNF